MRLRLSIVLLLLALFMLAPGSLYAQACSYTPSFNGTNYYVVIGTPYAPAGGAPFYAGDFVEYTVTVSRHDGVVGNEFVDFVWYDDVGVFQGVGESVFEFTSYQILVNTAAIALISPDYFELDLCAPVTPTNTPVPPTNTPVPPTNTPVPPTNTPVLPTNTPTRTNTPVPPTNTPTRTNTPVPPTNTATEVIVTVTPSPTSTPDPFVAVQARLDQTLQLQIFSVSVLVGLAFWYFLVKR